MNLHPFPCLRADRQPQRLNRHNQRSSENAGWTSLFASVQTENRFEGFFPAIEDHLVVITLKQPVRFSGRIGKQSQDMVLPPGSVTFTPGGADLKIRASVDSGDYETIYLYLQHELLDEMGAEMFEDQGEVTLASCIGVTDSMIEGIAVEIRGMLMTPARSDRFYAETLSRTLAACLLRNHASGRQRQMHSAGGLCQQELSRAIEYIACYLGENLSLATIAQAAGSSAARLTRGFKKARGCTPYEYVVRSRVERAKQLLISSELPLAEIAIQCGFSDQPHMNHIVRRATGLTPGTIRKNR